jgi:peptide/nickel transport system substrate-binding protein
MTLLRTALLAGACALGLGTGLSAETLRWGGGRDINSLDPYSFGSSYTLAFLNHVYEGLVRYDENLQIEPALATRWELLDERTWRFHLREGVTFHDGAPFTAQDVLASLTRVTHPTSPLRGNLPAYESAAVVDDLTIDITLTGPYPLLLNDLTNIHIFSAPWLVANDAELPTDFGAGVEGYATFNANGTGPFRAVERVPESRTVLEVFEGWWDEPQHNLTRIEFTPITSAATRVAALLSGEIDFTEDAPVQDLARLEAAPNVTPLVTSDLRTVFFGFNQNETLHDGRPNAFTDVRVRQAFAHALDLELIHQRIMRGMSRVSGSIVAPAIPGWREDLDVPPAHDPELARQLLQEAGAEGFSFSITCSYNDYVNEEEVCNSVIPMLNRAGFDATLDIGPSAIQSQKMSNRETDVFILGWANLPMLDSFSILVQVLHSLEGTRGVFNWGSWSYPELDALIDAASTELDFETRIGLQSQALELVRDETILVPLHQQPMAWASTTRVTDVLQLGDNKARHWKTRVAE